MLLGEKTDFCGPFKQVFDQDIGQDKRLGIAKLPLIELEAETWKDYELRLLPSLDTLKVKDKKDRGTVTLKVEHLNLTFLFFFTSCILVILDLTLVGAAYRCSWFSFLMVLQKRAFLCLPVLSLFD